MNAKPPAGWNVGGCAVTVVTYVLLGVFILILRLYFV